MDGFRIVGKQVKFLTLTTEGVADELSSVRSAVVKLGIDVADMHQRFVTARMTSVELVNKMHEIAYWWGEQEQVAI